MSSTSQPVAATQAAQAAQIRAIRSMGVVVELDPREWVKLLSRVEAPLVVHAKSGFFTRTHKYLASYKGMVFLTKSNIPIELGPDAEIVESKMIWVP